MRKSGLRIALALATVAVLALVLPEQASHIVLAATGPMVSLNVGSAGPRQVEDTTQRAVARDYAAAWQAMAAALDQNRTDLLAGNFIGTADDRLTASIKQQRKNGLHQQIVDKGHRVNVVFYSPEGSAMELYDTAQIQLQIMDGNKVVQSEDATVHYVALITAAENSWKVRMLEAVPGF
jgi:rhamnogalacturonyl hydrolase YesR